MKSPAVVIPTLNEESTIGDLLESLSRNSRITHIIIVDDASTDKTCELVAEHREKDPRIDLIRRIKPRSFAESYRDGFSAAIAYNADFVIQMDADGSHPADTLENILDTLETYDFVIGSRFIHGSKTTGRNATRRAVSRLGNGFARQALRMDIADMTGGFNGWRANVLDELLKSQFPYRGFVIQVWLKWSAAKKYTWQEIPFHFVERTHGASKFTFNIFQEGVSGIFEMRSGKLID